MEQITRTVFVLTTQLKEDQYIELKQTKEETDQEFKKRKKESLIESFEPYYIICNSRLELENRIKKLQKYNMTNYCFTEVQVNSFSIPIEKEIPKTIENIVVKSVEEFKSSISNGLFDSLPNK